MNNRTLNYAHRGFTANAIENTLAAFEAALDLGVDGIELDVRTCQSGEVVVFHDHRIDRLTAGTGLVKNMSLSDLKKYAIGGQDSGQLIPTLAEVLETIKGRASVNVEIKANGLPAGHAIEEKVVGILKDFGLLRETIISSFSPLIVRRVRKVDKAARSGFLVDKNISVRNGELLFTRVAGAQAIHLEHSLLTKTLARKISDRNYDCLVWTVNEAAQMRKFLNLGVYAIITDKPDLLKNIMVTPNDA